MDELIRKSDAIRAIAEHFQFDASLEHKYEHLEYFKGIAEHILQNVPTIERKRGEWIKHDDERDYCSVCKHIFKTRILTKQDKWTTYVDDLGFNFCPNCGASMK